MGKILLKISISKVFREHSPYVFFLFTPSAALLRGNRVNCAHFSSSLDWLISRLDRLEASSGWLDLWSFN